MPKHEIKKNKNRISSPIAAYHPQFSILTLNFSDFTKIQKKWMKSGLGARSGRTLRNFLLCLELMFNKSCQDNYFFEKTKSGNCDLKYFIILTVLFKYAKYPSKFQSYPVF